MGKGVIPGHAEVVAKGMESMRLAFNYGGESVIPFSGKDAGSSMVCSLGYSF